MSQPLPLAPAPIGLAAAAAGEPVESRIYGAVFDRVMNQRLPPGTKLPESALCEAPRQPDVAEKLKATDQSVVAGTPAQAAALTEAQSRKWGEVAQRIGLKLE